MSFRNVVPFGLILFLVGCIQFSSQDVCERDSAVDTWIRETTIRIEIINKANELSSSDLQKLYEEQTSQDTPTCLETAQAYAVESFLYQWDAVKARDENNLTDSLSFLTQSANASARMAKEIERIAELNSWQPVKIELSDETDDCSQSNPILANWLRETTPADTLSVAALEEATDQYTNPSDTGKQKALDWQERTIEAYDFMKEYQPVPQCMTVYHNHLTEMLLQLSLTFSELELVYVAIDTNQDYESHLSAAKEHLANALEASKASVSEWERLKSLGLPRP